MPQYDVFVNPNTRSPDSVPDVVDVQSTLLRGLRTRLTVPLSRVGIGQPAVPRRLVPTVVIAGEALALLPHVAAGVDARLLRSPVATLGARADDIRDALDAVVGAL